MEEDNPNNLTVDQLKLAVPANLKSSVTQELADKLNSICDDPDLSKTIQENFVTYTSVLREGKYKLDDYMNAVTYSSFKLMGLNNQDAYAKTFPYKYQALVAKGTSQKDISAYVASFTRGKLVTSIMEQSMIPFHILNQDARQKALNTLVDLMCNGKSERTRCVAADSVLNHTEVPAAQAAMVNVNINKYSGIDDLEKAMATLAQKQRDAIAHGVMSTKSVAESTLVDAEIIND